MDMNCIYIYFLIFIILLALLGIFNNSADIDVYNSDYSSKHVNSMFNITIICQYPKDISSPIHY